MAALHILRPGLLTTVQDCGRWGYQAKGVPVSGAMDVYSHRYANRLVGNPDETATLEVTLVGPHIEFDGDAGFAVSGAHFQLRLDGAEVNMNQAIEARAGSVLRFGERLKGARAYLAVAGGIAVPEVLGSRSTHVLSRMGGFEGRALRAGDRVPVERGSDPIFSSFVSLRDKRDENSTKLTKLEKIGSDPFSLPQGGARVRVLPQWDDLLSYLIGQRFHVSSRSDRMGYRLDGTPIERAPRGELLSHAVPTGALQVPPAGQPILLMADHATTGGYTVAAAVITADLPLAAQLAPGDWIEFEPCTLHQADTALREREESLAGAVP